jgi:hypothetical protein
VRPLPLLFAASLLANAVFVGYVSLRLAHSATAPADRLSQTAAQPRKGPDPLAEKFATAINTNDYAALRDLLKASGFPDDLVCSIIKKCIWKNYAARTNAIYPHPDPKEIWWKDDRSWEKITRDQQNAIRLLEHEASEKLIQVLGSSLDDEDREEQRLAFLPPEKIIKIKKIERDYAELRGEIYHEQAGFNLPSDDRKYSLLAEEQNRDIYAVMSTEERKAYDLRMSPTASNLRWKMSKLDVSQEEYLKIYAFQKAFDDKHNLSDPFAPNYIPGPPDVSTLEEREADKQKITQEIKAVIGDTRYEQSIKEDDNDYRQLQAATRRFNLPADTPNRLYTLLTNTAKSADEIAGNTTLSLTGKKQAIAELKAKIDSQVHASLGAEAGDVYLEGNNVMRNLQQLLETAPQNDASTAPFMQAP